MSTLKLRYPAGTNTNVWNPSVHRSVGNSGIDRESGIAADLMSDGFTQYAYRISEAHWRYPIAFNLLPGAEFVTLEAFFDIVLGDLFDFTDGTCGPVTDTRVVQLAVESYQRQWRLQPNGRVSGSFVLVDAD